jgi:hypothetical protein
MTNLRRDQPPKEPMDDQNQSDDEKQRLGKG